MANRASQLQLDRNKAPQRPTVSLDDALLDAELASIERAKRLQHGSDEPEHYCECPENWLRGKQLPAKRYHDCEYAKARSALVPQAEEIANRHVTVVSADEDRGASQALWVRCFAVAMEELSRPLLNGSAPPVEPVESESWTALCYSGP